MPCSKARVQPSHGNEMVGNFRAHLSSVWSINLALLIALDFILHTKGGIQQMSSLSLCSSFSLKYSPTLFNTAHTGQLINKHNFHIISLSSCPWCWFWSLLSFSPTTCTYWNCLRPSCVTTPSRRSSAWSPKGCGISLPADSIASSKHLNLLSFVTFSHLSSMLWIIWRWDIEQGPYSFQNKWVLTHFWIGCLP